MVRSENTERSNFNFIGSTYGKFLFDLSLGLKQLDNLMYGIITTSEIFVEDNILDPSGEPRKGILAFKKKTNAVEECEELNKIRSAMKIKQCYSVQKLTPEDIPDWGIILDGKWKKEL